MLQGKHAEFCQCNASGVMLKSISILYCTISTMCSRGVTHDAKCSLGDTFTGLCDMWWSTQVFTHSSVHSLVHGNFLVPNLNPEPARPLSCFILIKHWNPSAYPWVLVAKALNPNPYATRAHPVLAGSVARGGHRRSNSDGTHCIHPCIHVPKLVVH
jgi:hypothetical protein